MNENAALLHEPAPAPSWNPFRVLERGLRPKPPRAMETRDGVGDRLRTAAFAEIQAREAFLWAADRFKDAPTGLREKWRLLAREEEKHLNWLLGRMQELEIPITDRDVSDWLWVSLTRCQSAREFAVFMASAEERGRRAGERFHEALLTQDPVSARIFGQIALEELSHIRLAEEFYPDETRTQVAGNTPDSAGA